MAILCVPWRCHVLFAVKHHLPSLLMHLTTLFIPFIAIGLHGHCLAHCRVFLPTGTWSFPLHKPYNCKKWLMESNAVFSSSFLLRSVAYVNSMVDELSTNLCHMQGVICQVIGCCVDRSTCNHKRVEIILGNLAMWCYNIGKKFMLCTCSMGNRAMTTCAPHGFQYRELLHL